jgi:cytochrome c-type biogenesis protein CcmI
MVIWIAAILLIAAVALFVGAPLADDEFYSVRGAADPSAESKGRAHEHALAIQALRELEFDRATGKLDADDYRALREALETRALVTMTDLDDTRPTTSAFATAPPVSNAVTRAVIMRFCPQCGMSDASTHNFCPNCGGARLAEPRSTDQPSAK